MTRELIKRWLLKRGIVLSRPPGQFAVWDIKLNALKQRGLELNCVIDGGASDGGWARQLKDIYPNATVVCVEPRDEEQRALQQLARELPNIIVAPVLLGASTGSAAFNLAGVASSALNAAQTADAVNASTPMSTLDELIDSTGVPWPELIKLDLQGYEIEALRGGERCMERAGAMLLELSFFPFLQNQPIAEDVIAFARQRNFRLHDIPSLWHRPLDGALAQGDFLFVKEGHPLLSDNRWAATG